MNEGIFLECEVCGRKTKDLKLVMIEGAAVYACPSCAAGKLEARQPIVRVRKVTKKPVQEEEDKLLIIDYGKVIQKAAQAKGLTVEELAKRVGESESTMRKIIHEKLTPTEKTAAKLEKLLGIKLYE